MGEKSIKNRLLPLAICCVFFARVAAQSSETLGFPDSLLNYTYRELKDIFIPMKRDSLAAIPYMLAHTYKAKQDQDTMELAWSYRNLGWISSPKVEEMYVDSMLQQANNNHNQKHLTLIYCSVAMYNEDTGNYHKALAYHLQAYEHSIRSGNRKLQARQKYKIGLMKSVSGNKDDAIRIFKELLRNYRDSANFDLYHKKKGFLNAHFQIMQGYLYKEELDSARVYLNIGLEKSPAIDSAKYWMFHGYKGVLAYKEGDYDSAIAWITESLPHRRYLRGPFYSYFHRGSAYLAMDSVAQGMQDYRKADSLGLHNNLNYGERLVIYKTFAEYYAAMDSTERELEYIKKYLWMDSIIDRRYALFKDKISENFDTPLMLQKKEAALARLQAKSVRYKSYWAVTGGMLLAVSGLLFFNMAKRRTLSQRFEELTSAQEANTPFTTGTKGSTAHIPQEVVTGIQTALVGFERDLGYLSNDLNLTSLAKQLKTNPNYLSKVINVDKNKNFNSYINDLRVSHAVRQLQKDAALRKYSIKAIAEEMGFNNAESFSKAFKKTTGMYPSYFIKKLHLKLEQHPG